MAHITLTDNSIANPPPIPAVLKSDTPSEQAIHVFQDLQQVSGKSLGELCTESENLLVFPHCLKDHNNGLQELSVCELVGRPCYDKENRLLHVNEVKIKTGNLMGFIGFSGKGSWGTQLEIRSRFTDNSKEDFFLHYLLERVFKINLFNLEYSFTHVPGLDFLYLLFPYFLKKALGQGVFRSYQPFDKNDSAVRGTVNIPHHLRQNLPFKGTVAYRSREYSYDNSITQLIRHTIEFIRRKEMGQRILSLDEETRQGIKQIEMATNGTYSLQKRQKVLQENIRPVHHPYYTQYRNLQKLCLMILNHSAIKYEESRNSLYGLLFDGAWLWEEYLARILCAPELGTMAFCHPENMAGRGGLSLFDNSCSNEGETAFSKCYRRIYPDFYRQNSHGTDVHGHCSGELAGGVQDGVVLDAKYKHLEKSLVRDDLYQIISYMHTMKMSCGGFLYPYRCYETAEDLQHQCYKLANNSGIIHVLGIPIPQAEDYNHFKVKMKALEADLMKHLNHDL